MGEGGGGADSGDAVSAEALGGAGDEVPGSSFRDQAEGVDCAWTGLSVGAGVVEGKFAVASYGVLDDGEHGQVLCGRVPAGGIDVKALADGGSLFAQADGEGSHQLSEGPFGGGAHGRVGEGAGLGHEEGAELGFVKAGDVGAPVALELPPALCSAERRDGHVGGAEGFHIAVDGALGDLEAIRELAAGNAALGLKEEQRGEETVGLHRMAIFTFFELFYFPERYMTVHVIYGILCFGVSREQISRPKENWPWN